MAKEKAIMTNGIPQCPHCKKPTERTTSGGGRRTAKYYRPHYDEDGKNTNPDKNRTTRKYTCLSCGNTYAVASGIDGAWYKDTIDVKKVIVDGRKGHTTSIIPHSDGKYPVWYDGADHPDFVEADQVTFI